MWMYSHVYSLFCRTCTIVYRWRRLLRLCWGDQRCVSHTGHSGVRRSDGISFDCQPVLEIHTALDFKYPSYSRGRAGDRRPAGACRRLARHGPQWTHQLGTTAPTLSSVSAGIDRTLSGPLWRQHLTTPTKPPTPPWTVLAARQWPNLTSCYTMGSPPITMASIKGT